MKEIETKILEINTQQVESKLLELGAKKVFDGEVEMVSLDFPNKTLKEKRQLLRIRKLGDKVELCFKEKKEYGDGFKTREETEVTTSNYEDTIKIFQNIGMQIIHRGKKHRISYRLHNISFEIDEWGDVPSFLEVEAPSKEEVVEWVEKLGFSMDQATDMHGGEVEKYYRKKNEK